MDALIQNAVVITCDDGGSVIENGAVAVLGKRIEEVGESGEMARKYESLERIVTASCCRVSSTPTPTPC